ncbi:MAG: hypothetical protein NC393_08115 [Clostridium sp.]|nr:hypothetical protein [Clostridium sp.]MCM1207646.1 hypothetical protein [Ruminococcus sp.]
MIKGQTIQLKIRRDTGQKDEFNRPIYDDSYVKVDDVLIGEPSSDEITNALTLTGKKVAYTLAIPKTDSNNWTDTEVILWGEHYKTIGNPVQGIDENMPLRWNKKVKVERCE